MQVIKRIVTFALIILLSSPLFAQPAIGIRGGINYGSVSEPEIIGGILPDFKSIIGLNLALVGEIPLGNNFSFQPELAYAQKGFKIQEGLNVDLFKIPIPIGAKVVTKVNYMEVPLLAKYRFGSEKVNAYLTAGPVLSYATGGKLQTKAQILFDIPITSTDLDLDALGYQRFDFSASVGAGLSVDTGAGELFVDARYVHGFNNVYDVPLVDLKLKNKGFGINVGYMISLGNTGSPARRVYP